MMISGSTRLIAFLGDPIQQAQSPQILNAIFQREEVDAACVPINVDADGFELALKGLQKIRNLDGLIATIPHKFAVARMADELGDNARFVGVANVMKRGQGLRWIAELFDGVGFVDGLKAAGIDVRDKSFLLVGAGGAGSAIATALSQAEVAAITVLDVDRARASTLVDKLEKQASGISVNVCSDDTDAAAFDVIVNATPLGMGEHDPLPIDPGRFSTKSVVADIIMKPRMTRLLKEAERRGCRIHLGHHMIDHQIPRFLEFFGYGDLVRSTQPAPAVP